MDKFLLNGSYAAGPDPLLSRLAERSPGRRMKQSRAPGRRCGLSSTWVDQSHDLADSGGLVRCVTRLCDQCALTFGQLLVVNIRRHLRVIAPD